LILVTVGTHNHGFDRLVKAMDELAAEVDEPVMVQYGSSVYVPRHAEHFQWTSGQRMEQLSQAARVIVTHAAAGSILVALLREKPLVVVPRLRRCTPPARQSWPRR
jgi:UDP-N-acetylglucosamine transferase subunit ALG13